MEEEITLLNGIKLILEGLANISAGLLQMFLGLGIVFNWVIFLVGGLFILYYLLKHAKKNLLENVKKKDTKQTH